MPAPPIARKPRGNKVRARDEEDFNRCTWLFNDLDNSMKKNKASGETDLNKPEGRHQGWTEENLENFKENLERWWKHERRLKDDLEKRVKQAKILRTREALERYARKEDDKRWREETEKEIEKELEEEQRELGVDMSGRPDPKKKELPGHSSDIFKL